MKSRPVMEALFVAVLFGLAAVPLWRLTGGVAPTPAAEHPADATRGGDAVRRGEAGGSAGDSAFRSGADAPASSVHARIRVSHPVASLEILIAGNDSALWSWRASVGGGVRADDPTWLEGPLPLAVGAGDVLDLRLRIAWAHEDDRMPPRSTAATVVLEPDGLMAAEATAWGEGDALDAILTFSFPSSP